jgi:alanine dehydrogenase
MIIGVPKEIKNNENRVSVTPEGAKVLTARKHQVIVEKNAGLGSGFQDQEYKEAGAIIEADTAKLFAESDMIIKVKEPLPEEYDLFKNGQILYTYLHLAAEEELTELLIQKNIVSIAYETVELKDGSLPLLTPMSEVAGRLSAQEGAKYLEKPMGGRGVLLGGVPGVPPAKAVVIGGGTVGLNSAKMLKGLGADVTILDIDAAQLRYIDDIFSGIIKTRISNSANIHDELRKADLVIGAVLIHGAKAPKLVTKEMIKDMKDGSVIVDVAIDQGGCVEGAYPTTHDDPVYIKQGVVHYSVANMPGSVARTATLALTNVTLPYAVEIAEKGYKKALLENKALLKGLNVYQGKITYKSVAEAFAYECYDPAELLKEN